MEVCCYWLVALCHGPWCSRMRGNNPGSMRFWWFENPWRHAPKSPVFQTSTFPSFLDPPCKSNLFLFASDPLCHFPSSFQSSPSIRVHQGRLLGKRIIEKEPDLMEKSLGQMKVMAWWESNGTRLRTRSTTVRTLLIYRRTYDTLEREHAWECE